MMKDTVQSHILIGQSLNLTLEMLKATMPKATIVQLREKLLSETPLTIELIQTLKGDLIESPLTEPQKVVSKPTLKVD